MTRAGDDPAKAGPKGDDRRDDIGLAYDIVEIINFFC